MNLELCCKDQQGFTGTVSQARDEPTDEPDTTRLTESISTALSLVFSNPMGQNWIGEITAGKQTTNLLGCWEGKFSLWPTQSCPSGSVYNSELQSLLFMHYTES
jgi:hypothetical protein